MFIKQDLYATIMSTATFLDEMRCSPEIIDQPKVEEIIDVIEHVSEHIPHSPKRNLVVSSSVRDLLECPVCLNAMYPPIHQVSLLNNLNSRIKEISLVVFTVVWSYHDPDCVPKPESLYWYLDVVYVLSMTSLMGLLLVDSDCYAIIL